MGQIEILRPGELVISDENYLQHARQHLWDNEEKARGRIARDLENEPFGSIPYTAPFSGPTIPRHEWPERIREMTMNKSRLSDIRRAANNGKGIPSLNQGRTNYCWAHGPGSAMLLVRAKDNQPFVKLSPASVAAPIKGYRNQGGWGGQALQYIVEHGMASEATWPANSIDRSHFAGSREDAAKHKVTEWLELARRNFDQLMTCLLRGEPVAIGLNWWRHEVCAVDPVEISPGRFGARIWNSWGDSYGTMGEAVLTESKATPDDAVAPQVISPSVD
jgi:hypothetical protein